MYSFFSLFISSKRLAFISVQWWGRFFKIDGDKNLFGNFSKYFCDKVFHSNLCQNFSGVPFLLFYQFRHPYIYSSSFPESMQKVKIRAISVCPLMCVMLPLPCNRQGVGGSKNQGGGGSSNVVGIICPRLG